MKKLYDMMGEAAEMYRAREEGGVKFGLLYPSLNSIWSYKMPAVGWYAQVQEYLVEPHGVNGTFKFFGCIKSFDDSGMSIWGPLEAKEKAEARRNEFVSFLESYEFRCPTWDDMREFDKVFGTYTEFW